MVCYTHAINTKEVGSMRKIRIPKDLLKELYEDKGMTLQQIADEFGVNRQTISNKLKEYGICIRNSKYISEQKKKNRKPKKLKKIEDYRNRQVYKKVYKDLKSIDQVAEYFNIDIKTAFKWKKRHNIETIKEYSQKGRKQLVVDKPYANKEWLEEMYSKYSLEDLGKMLNCSPSTIGKWCKKFGIKTRSVSEQWELKSKNGANVIKPSGFDLQLYKKTYAIGRNSYTIPKSLKQFIISLYGKCESCGYDEVLDLHHIDENHKNNDPSNHSVLCPNCHAKIHRLGISFHQLVPNHIVWSDLVKDSYQEAK